MVPNKKRIRCEVCGSPAEVEVVPDGFDDEPATFVLTRTCSGACKKVYVPLTAQEMSEQTGLPRKGWCS